MAAGVDVRLVSPRRRRTAECWQKVFSDATTTMVEEDCGLFASTCCIVQTMKSLSSVCLVCVAYNRRTGRVGKSLEDGDTEAEAVDDDDAG